MKPTYTPIVASDYSDGTTRRTIFQLCLHEAGRRATHASVQFEGEKAVCLATKALSPRSQAVIRLARIYRSRSIPQVFAAMPSPFINGKNYSI